MNNLTYSCIYKISSIDPKIIDCYVGSTSNFIKRRQQHKNKVVNGYNKYAEILDTRLVYTFIRANGGWNNWHMIEIEKCDKNELLKREQYWIDILKPSLNKIKTIRKV
jgi:predicted GIY-YIG superfamily endonuclease